MQKIHYSKQNFLQKFGLCAAQLWPQLKVNVYFDRIDVYGVRCNHEWEREFVYTNIMRVSDQFLVLPSLHSCSQSLSLNKYLTNTIHCLVHQYLEMKPFCYLPNDIHFLICCKIIATMLQKLSKCEVKAWLCLNLIILPPLWFWWIQTVQKCHFWQF